MLKYKSSLCLESTNKVNNSHECKQFKLSKGFHSLGFLWPSLVGNATLHNGACCLHLHTSGKHLNYWGIHGRSSSWQPYVLLLSNLYFLDLYFTTTTILQLLLNLCGSNKSISCGGCVIQFYMFHFLGPPKYMFLVVMPLDHYMAIQKPWKSPAIMHQWLCILLVVMAWLSSLATSLLLAHHLAATLWWQDRWLPVWSPSDDQDVMCWYHIQYSYALHCGDFLVPVSLVIYPYLLWIYCSYSAQNKALRGKEEGL